MSDAMRFMNAFKHGWTNGAAILGAVAALAAVSACGSSETADAPEQPEPIAVTTMAAAIEEVPERIEAGGTVAAGTTAAITSRVVAPVMELRVQAGDRVRKDQVLVVLDDRALGAQARQATASAGAAEQALTAARTDQAAARADQELADAWHGRVAALHERKAATAQELDEAKARRASAAARLLGAEARVEQAIAQIAAARAAADSARTTQEFTVVRAPFDGLVTETMADPGNLASPGAPLLRIDALGAARVEVSVDEMRAAHVRTGDRVAVLFESSSQPKVEGTVAEVARMVAAGERAFTVKVSLPAGLELRTGTFARVQFRGPLRPVLLVPADAIRRQGQIATVFVVNQDTARLRFLQTGMTIGERVEVLAGLEPGEAVIVSPPPSLADGRRVTATPLAPPAGKRR